MDSLYLLSLHEGVIVLVSLLTLGACSGFMAGLLGVGGGTILVPGFFYLFTALGIPAAQYMHLFVGTSLAIIVVNGFMSARTHHLRHAVDWLLVKQIGIGVLLGAFLGSYCASIMAGPALKLSFAIVVVCLAVIMFLDPKRFSFSERILKQPFAALVGGGMGCISTLAGIGGGAMSVPYMVMGRVPILIAVGTASALGVLTAVPATLGFVVIGWGEEDLPPFSLGYVNLLAWTLIVPTSLFCAPMGAKVAHSLNVKLLRRVFASFLAILAVKMLLDVF